MTLYCYRISLVAGILGWSVAAIPGTAQVPTQHTRGPQGAVPPAVAATLQDSRSERLVTPVTLDFRNVTLETVLREIDKQANLQLFYTARVVPLETRVSIRVTKIPAHEALRHVLAGTHISVKTSTDGKLTLVRDTADTVADGQRSRGILRGTVIDSATRKGIEGVTVLLSGTRTTTITTSDGRFLLRDVVPGKQTVEAKLFGYKSGSASTVVNAEQPSTVTIVLAGLATSLTEVVTTVTGSQRRVEMGNSVTSLNVDSIVRNTAVNTLTDVIDAGRVPGLIVSRASGAPGAPAKIRIRGLSSINATTDPIIIVDGVRVYSDQTNTGANADYSVLDRIDLNSVETLDVFKGPSASAMYGSDAANGVLVITTKRGVPGQTRWAFGTNQQRTTQPGRFPDLYYREGTPLDGGRPIHCLLGVECMNDTVYAFNPLSNARTSVLGAGIMQSYTASVNGGASALRYSITGSFQDETGLLKLPDADVETLELQTGRSIPGWLQKPQHNSRISATGGIDIQMTPAFLAKLTTNLNHSVRKTTPLSRVLGVYSTGAPGDTSVITGSIPDYRKQQTYPERSLRNSLTGTWTGQRWLNVSGNAGYDAALRTTEELIRRGDCVSYDHDSCAEASSDEQAMATGAYVSWQTALSVASLNMNAAANLPKILGIRLMPNAGFEYRTTASSESKITANGLALGATSSRGADTIVGQEQRSRSTLAGMFLGTRVAVFDRLYTGFQIRVDASNALGARVRPTYPKLDFSYLISEESWFPDLLSQLRLRAAYGHAAVQPEPGAQLQTYRRPIRHIDGVPEQVLILQTPGNPDLRPERSKEFEGGLDVGMLQERVTLSVTLYDKLTKDAFTTVSLPGSAGLKDRETTSLGYTANLGSVRNRGIEAQYDILLVDGATVSWAIDGGISKVTNRLESLAPGMGLDFGGIAGFNFFGSRNVVGYPVNGQWILPMLAYEDRNQDGILTSDEIIRSDSSVFVGGTQPDYEISFGSNLRVWNGRVTLGGRIQHQGGLAQINRAALENLTDIRLGNQSYSRAGAGQTLRGLNDPTVPISEQALIRSGHAFVRSVSTTRIASFSISAIVPPAIVSRLRARTMTVSLQGSNLALWSSYSGIDPNVNNSIVGNDVRDNGNLPLPRTWGLNVSIGY